MGSREKAREIGGTGHAKRRTVSDVEAERARAGREGGSREEVADRAVRCMDARAALAGVGLEMRSSMRASDVEAGVGHRGHARQRELQGGCEQPTGADDRGPFRHRDHWYLKLIQPFLRAR